MHRTTRSATPPTTTYSPSGSRNSRRIALLLENGDSPVVELIRQKARELIRHPGFRQSELEDVQQELTLELLRKSSGFDPRRGCEEAFVSRVIRSKAVSLVRARTCEKRNFRRHGRSLNELVSDAEYYSVERSQTCVATAAQNHTFQSSRSVEDLSQLRVDVADVVDALPEDLRKLANLLSTMSRHAAAHVLGRSRRQVGNDVRRLRRRFESAELHKYL